MSTFREIPPIENEEDIPDNAITTNENDNETILSRKQIEELEAQRKMADALSNIHLKEKAFSLIVKCLIGLALMCILETYLINKDYEVATSFSPLFELLKFLVSSLTGYLFCIKTRETED